MALIFLGVPIIFNVFSFEVSSSQIAVTSLPLMSGPQFIRPQSTGLSDLGGGNAGVLLQAATKAKNSSQVYRFTLADLVCLAGESH